MKIVRTAAFEAFAELFPALPLDSATGRVLENIVEYPRRHPDAPTK